PSDPRDCFALLAMTPRSILSLRGAERRSNLDPPAPTALAVAGCTVVRPVGSVRPAGLVEAVAQLLAGLEKGDVLLGDLNAVAGARVAPDAGIAALDRKGAE